MKKFTLLLVLLFWAKLGVAQDNQLNGLAIEIPEVKDINEFINFIETEFPKRNLNLLVLRVGYKYKFKKRPELSYEIGNYTEADIKKIVAACKKLKIKLVPLYNLLGHQSWEDDLYQLLTVYPEFDETPNIKLPEKGKWTWPNPDSLYCKSYCPLHPEVHNVVFDVLDEWIDAFEATDFHIGLDEVFYIGHKDCPRCKGKDKAELFANEVNKINQHLKSKDVRLWMWGDRLINSTAINHVWEASDSGTDRAIDLIDKDVVICDWHYEIAFPTAAYFALKGFSVFSCPWRTPEVGLDQQKMLSQFKKGAGPELKQRYLGILHTVWSTSEEFIKEFNKQPDSKTGQANTFRAVFPVVN